MDKDELKERIHVPLLGFSAVLMSIVAFLLLLYGITVESVSFLRWGRLGSHGVYQQAKQRFQVRRAALCLPCRMAHFRQGGAVTCGFALPCLMCVS